MDLTSRGIELLSETPSFAIFARANLIALVERAPSGYGSIGSTGMMTENGLAYLVWRNGRALLAGKGFELDARDDDVEAIRQFSEDLKSALANAGRT